TNLAVYDGNTRRDLFKYIPSDGTYIADEMFTVGRQNPDGTLSITYPSSGTWVFYALDGSARQGKLSRITDRNGNPLSFDYDGLGRLSVIHDTLDTPSNPRVITVGYNSDGFISTLTDFGSFGPNNTHRQVHYDYYHSGDAGGSAGDLKS